MAKRTADPILVTTAERVGRTLGRIAKQLDKVKAIAAKANPKGRRAPAKKRAKPSAAALAAKAKIRESWTAQAEAEKVVVKSRSRLPVDERALAHAKDGKRWAARKPR